MIDNTKFVLPRAQRIPGIEMRRAYCGALIAEAERNPKITAIEVDVMHSMGTEEFAARFPDRSVNCGIQEANAIGVAAGLSIRGYTPFFHAFGIFASRRVFDQVFLSCGYAQAPIKIIGGDAGITAAANGGTHMPLEDIALMRSVPGMTVIEPADEVSMKQLVPQIARLEGNVYCRCTRKSAVSLYTEEAELRIGEASLVRDGKDAVIIASGLEVCEALEAAEVLDSQGMSVAVIDAFSISPIDTEAIIQFAVKTGAVITAENHRINGGIGSAVSEILGEAAPTSICRIGVKADQYGEVGDVDFLKRKFKLTSANIAEAAQRIISKE